jgi:hypothetical protein
MAIKDLKKILEQVHEPNEFQLVAENMNHSLYWIWKLEFRKEHARFDIFINGQYILERDYIREQVNNDLHIKFKKSNFGFNLQTSDDIKIEGDIVRI